MKPQNFYEMGIAVIPIKYRDKKPDISHWQQYQTELPNTGQIARWFRPGRQINAAVICGWKGLVVLDFDDMQKYLEWLAWAIAEGGTALEVAIESYRVKTSRGMHVYVFCEDAPRCGHFSGGDIKGLGGYVLIPPSVHPSGAIYTAVDSSATIRGIKSLSEIIPDPPPEPTVRPQPTQHVFAMSALWPKSILEQIIEQMPILSHFPDAQPTGGGGRWYMAKCPWHDDKSPSLWIDTQRGLCGCYSGCTPKPLDTLGAYARIRGIDDRAAIRELIRR